MAWSSDSYPQFLILEISGFTVVHYSETMYVNAYTANKDIYCSSLFTSITKNIGDFMHYYSAYRFAQQLCHYLLG